MVPCTFHLRASSSKQGDEPGHLQRGILAEKRPGSREGVEDQETRVFDLREDSDVGFFFSGGVNIFMGTIATTGRR
jgi:hypothetical protein